MINQCEKVAKKYRKVVATDYPILERLVQIIFHH